MPRGRPKTGQIPSFAFRLPPEHRQKILDRAKAEGMRPSAVAREIFRKHFDGNSAA